MLSTGAVIGIFAIFALFSIRQRGLVCQFHYAVAYSGHHSKISIIVSEGSAGLVFHFGSATTSCGCYLNISIIFHVAVDLFSQFDSAVSNMGRYLNICITLK